MKSDKFVMKNNRDNVLPSVNPQPRLKLRFKQQRYQTLAVDAVVDCFKGQANTEGIGYRIDPGMREKDKKGYYQTGAYEESGFKNAGLLLNDQQLLENIQQVQRLQNLPQSGNLAKTKISPINLDVEMETGTGKTYCYIKTIFEMNKRYGWNKFIVVVPSIAIREGVYKSFEITAEHFQESYGKKVKFFIYNSKQLHNLESFSSDAGINTMIINVQAFNATGKDARRIYEELDDFQTRRPIDVIKANRPVLILDEPQKMEGTKTLDSLKEFNPLFILRYSATHKTEHNKIHRLDALDAYNQKLVKKIAVRGISVKGLSGTNAYLYLESIGVSKQSPVARIEMEIKHKNGIKREIRKLNKGNNLFTKSEELDQYRGFVISDINAITDTVSFTNGVELTAGEVTGDINELTLRRIQIREAIRSHFEKEQILFHQGIKVLSLFFIDEVAKYRKYTEAGEEGGEYAKIFEEEYIDCVNELKLLFQDKYRNYLDGIEASKTHNGYFSIDKKSNRLIDPKMSATERKQGEANDVDAYDLILKDKERLLSFGEPIRFIFSHSALREGWDNPNVFVICTLKHSDSTISRRQEVGRGLRIAVNQLGERQDNPATVHQTNVLTVVASESYKDFVSGLQKDISISLSDRPHVADEAFFTGKTLQTETGPVEVTAQMAKQIYKYLLKNDYTDDNDNISNQYIDAVKNESLAPLPDDLKPFKDRIFKLIDSVYSDAKLPQIENDRGAKTNLLNDNFNKKEFKELWSRINNKAAYTVYFDSSELIEKCVKTLDKELRVKPLQYTIQHGEQKDNISYEQIKAGEGFEIQETATQFSRKSIRSAVKYDLIGKICEAVQLTRKTVSEILRKIQTPVFAQFKTNPENFISEASRLINEQKATVIIEHLTYNIVSGTHDINIFTDAQVKQDFSKAGDPLKRHIYDYVITESKNERAFVKDLDTSAEVVLYAKLPKGFFIPTPVGNYNPDWAITFKEGLVKHVYFVAETKGSMSSMELREIEKTKIECARRFFDEINKKINPEHVKYDVVDSYGKLMELVNDCYH
ncbi:MAG: DEAD/DEAH box helicase family protein [Desulfobacterales bacterium]